MPRAAIESRSGEVEKYIGDAVVGSFGVHHARGDDAERAVAAALAIVEAVAAGDPTARACARDDGGERGAVSGHPDAAARFKSWLPGL